MPSTDDVPHGPAHHWLSWQEFDLLARSSGGPEAVRRLRAAERSRRLLLLRGLIDDTAANPELHAPLPSPKLAWELLERAEEADPSALDAVLVHPYTGSWAGLITRVLRNPGIDPRPVWLLLGHVHSLAAAAALRAGLDSFRIAVPVWNGDVALPTLGVARLPRTGEFTTAEVCVREGEIVVTDGVATVRIPSEPVTDTPGWLGLRTFELVSGGKQLTLRLDDVDPYRGLFRPLAPERLSDGDLSHWHGMLSEAWRLLVTHAPGFADALPIGLDSIVPEPSFPFRLPSASSGEAFGSAVICRPDDPAALAATLLHEFQHIRLGGLLQLVRLHDDDRRQRIYAPWRDDPRPLGGVIHGIYAFFGVTAFYRALSAACPDDDLAAFEFAHWRHQVWHTLDGIRKDDALTEAGDRFLGQVAEAVLPWLDEPVSPMAAHWAAWAAMEHHGGWRLRHFRPDSGYVAELAAAWRSGLSCPALASAEPSLVTDPDGEWSEARIDLLRVRLGPDGERRAREVWTQVPGLSEADFALIDGRAEDAITEYRADLRRDPDAPGSLIGLGLALRHAGQHRTAEVLLERPELVRAVHRILRDGPRPSPSPEDVARWIGA
ncbi:aKG-HExxH-type peptide beta-hydroxylase [Amycolatopsis sp. NPDC003731]